MSFDTDKSARELFLLFGGLSAPGQKQQVIVHFGPAWPGAWRLVLAVGGGGEWAIVLPLLAMRLCALKRKGAGSGRRGRFYPRLGAGQREAEPEPAAEFNSGEAN